MLTIFSFIFVTGIKFYASIILIISSLLVLNKNSFFSLRKNILKYKKLILIFIGSIHGLTNMGGGFLSIFSSLINNEDKNLTRYLISYGYLIMGLLQYFILLLLEYKNLNFSKIYYIFLVLLIYFPSQNIFKRVNNFLFKKIISIITLLYGFIILILNFYFV